MKCPKCSYTSFDYLQECKKCGEILDGSRKSLNLNMGIPTIFANIGSRDEELNDLDKSIPETTFIDTQDEPVESGLLLGNEFSEPMATNFEASPAVGLNLENELELGGLGSMNSMEPRSESEFELAQQENIVLDDIELSPTFSDNNTDPAPELMNNETASLDDSGLDLFAELDETDKAPADQLENDIAFELSMNDSEIDLGLAETPTSEPDITKNNFDDGTIELDLDMDDDESLDDLLADLEKKG